METSGELQIVSYFDIAICQQVGDIIKKFELTKVSIWQLYIKHHLICGFKVGEMFS